MKDKMGKLSRFGLLLTVPYFLGAAEDVKALDTLPNSAFEISPIIDYPGAIIDESRVAEILQLSELDLDRDGVIDIEGVLFGGDIIYRQRDSFSQVEENYYHVPSNLVWDGTEFTRLKAVIVDSDNLTYLFREGTSEVIAVFPNGTGSSGANTVPSLRRVHYIAWGVAAGQALQQRLGLGDAYNYFGNVYLDTRYVVAPGMENDINTPQEVHGTDPRLNFYLGTEISGGCTRHRNEDAEFIARHLQVGDLLMTRLTPFDDELNNPLNMLNQTRMAAGIPTAAEQYDGMVEFMLPPANFTPNVSDLSEINQPVWQDRQQVRELSEQGQIDQLEVPFIRHPYTYAHYDIIPCGSENMFMINYLAGRYPLVEVNGGYQLNVSQTISLPERIGILDNEGNLLNALDISVFYSPRTINYDSLNGQLHNFSGGDPEIAVYQALLSDYAVQFSRWYVQQKYQMSVGEDFLNNLSELDLREIQQVIGLIPTDYTFGTSPVMELASLRNRTVIHALMNVFHGRPGNVYELDEYQPEDAEAFSMTDVYFVAPSLDHELTRNGESQSMYQLLEQAIETNSGVIFRISGYRYLSSGSLYFHPEDGPTLDLRLAAAHYYSLIPDYTDLEEGFVGIFDSMHPHKILFAPVEALPQLFTTMTVTPAGES